MTAMMEKLALERLELAPENLRQEPDPEALEALKASIREVGLLQGLVGYEQGGRVFVPGGHLTFGCLWSFWERCARDLEPQRTASVEGSLRAMD